MRMPGGNMQKMLAQAQRAQEQSGCVYSLRGWSQDNAVYYATSCLPGYWRYDPAVGGEPAWVWRLPGELAGQLDDGERAGRALQYPERPRELGGKVTWYLVYQVSRSPDGQWLVAAVRNYYGPSDVVVVGSEDAVP